MATAGLSPEQLARFESDGFLVLPDFSPQDAADLRSAAAALVDAFDLASHPMTRFTTGDREAHVSGEYFLSSGDKVRFFFEESAIDQSGRLVVDKSRALNKVGHALHELVPEFKSFSLSPRIRSIASSLAYKDPRILQSMLIFKQPLIGGAVPPHQDSTFLYTEPLSAVGFWFALQDCTPENGCMWFLPGSHKKYPVWRRFIRRPDNTSVDYINIADPVPEPPASEYVCAPVKAGSLVLIHGSVLHKSDPNLSELSRWIYTFHCIEGQDAGNVYPPNNWLQPTPEMPFTKL